MQIVALENEPSSLLGGQELNLVEICSSLANRGHQINLVYTRKGDLLQQYRKFCNYLINVNRYTPQRKMLPEIARFLVDVGRDILKIPVSRNSVIFCNDFSSVFFGSILSSLKGIPLVHYIQLPAYKFKFKLRLGLYAVDQFIAVSNHTKCTWVDLGIPENKVNVVYNGIDTEKFKPPENFLVERKKLDLSEDKTVILYVGRLNRNKGIEVLIKAVALAVKSGINAHLLIAGNPVLELNEDSLEAREQYKHSLKSLAADLGIEKDVKLLGHVASTTTLYQVSDITVVPSTWPEPFGRVVIESMACGTPVVASRIGGIPEILMPFDDWLFGQHPQCLSGVSLVSLRVRLSKQSAHLAAFSRVVRQRRQTHSSKPKRARVQPILGLSFCTRLRWVSDRN